MNTTQPTPPQGYRLIDQSKDGLTQKGDLFLSALYGEWREVNTCGVGFVEYYHYARPLPARRVYLAGPMRGIKDFNFPAFHAAAVELRAKGYEVFNPAEHDEENHGKGFNLSATGDLKDIAHTPFDLRETLEKDLSWIAQNATAIALLPGWEKSKGARAESALAYALGLETILVGTHKLNATIGCVVGETRITDPATGGQKGQKLERFDLIPTQPLEELARLYGKGALKYTDDNWRKGYSWKLSFGALMRHAWAFWRGESVDKETGCHHLASVAWHCFTLQYFEKHHPAKDDRRDK